EVLELLAAEADGVPPAHVAVPRGPVVLAFVSHRPLHPYAFPAKKQVDQGVRIPPRRTRPRRSRPRPERRPARPGGAGSRRGHTARAPLPPRSVRPPTPLPEPAPGEGEPARGADPSRAPGHHRLVVERNERVRREGAGEPEPHPVSLFGLQVRNDTGELVHPRAVDQERSRNDHPLHRGIALYDVDGQWDEAP